MATLPESRVPGIETADLLYWRIDVDLSRRAAAWPAGAEMPLVVAYHRQVGLVLRGPCRSRDEAVGHRMALATAGVDGTTIYLTVGNRADAAWPGHLVERWLRQQPTVGTGLDYAPGRRVWDGLANASRVYVVAAALDQCLLTVRCCEDLREAEAHAMQLLHAGCLPLSVTVEVQG